jgi:hypothetical protein
VKHLWECVVRTFGCRDKLQCTELSHLLVTLSLSFPICEVGTLRMISFTIGCSEDQMTFILFLRD